MMKGLVLILLLVLTITGYYFWWNCCPQKPRARKNKTRILCIGDSITFGAGVSLLRWKNSYPAILNRLLGKKYQVLNYGIPGATAQSGTDHPYDAPFWEAAKQTAPEICLLMLGTNDSKPHNRNAVAYRKALKNWIEKVEQMSSHPSIVLVAAPAAFSVGGEPIVYEIQDEVIRNEIVPTVKELAEEYHTCYVDLYTETKAHPEWFGDGVHPNAGGNQQIAAHIYKGLNKIMWRD